MLNQKEILELYDNLIDSLGVYRKKGEQIMFDCPKCDEGHKKNLECNVTKKMFNCWSCGYRGSVRKLFREYSPSTIIKYQNYFNSNDVIYGTDEREINLPKKMLPYFKFKDVKQYLNIDRGINDKELIERRVKYVYDNTEMYFDHIVYPFYEKGKLLSACLYNFETKKYRNLNKLNFVPYKEFIDKNYPITLTEGVIDCLSSFNSIPLLGTTLNKQIIEFLLGTKVIVALDSKVKPSHYIELLSQLEKNNITEVEVFNLYEFEDMNDFYLGDKKRFLEEYQRCIQNLK